MPKLIRSGTNPISANVHWLGRLLAITVLMVGLAWYGRRFFSSNPSFKSSDLTKVGVVATPVLLIILTTVAATWWKILGLL